MARTDGDGWSEWSRPSVIALLLANLIPLGGVLFLGWEVFPIVLLFWCENLVVGAFNALKMLLAAPGLPAAWGAKAFMVPFFCVHYGIFCLVHGVFVFVLFGGGGRMLHGGPPGPAQLAETLSQLHLGWAVLGLVVSHGVSFVTNYLMAGEYRTAQLPTLMAAPYGRIVVLHLTILGGGFLLMALGSPMVGLLLLVALKIGLDVRAHLRERRRFQTGQTPDADGPL